MSSVLEKIENSQVVLTITVPKEDVAAAFKQAYKNVANKVNIPGFRKGKAPRHIIDMRLGKDYVKGEAFELAANKAYREALKEHDLIPVSDPSADEGSVFEEGKEASLKVKVTVRPEVELGQYKELAVSKKAVNVTEEDVNKAIADLQNHYATMVVVEGEKTKNGDIVMIDFEGSIDGVPFNGGAGKSYPLELGSGSFIPGFEEQLIGLETGSDTVVKVSFPEDYNVAELAGKASEFKVTIHEIKRKQLPELTDEFAKEADFKDLADLKESTQKRLTEAAETQADQDYREELLKLAVANTQVDIPEVLVQDKIENILAEFVYSLESRGLKLENYLQYVGKSMTDLKESYREPATEKVKAELILDAIAKAEELKVSAEELEAEIQNLAQVHNTSFKEVKKVLEGQGTIGVLVANIIRRKAFDVILLTAKSE